MSSEIERLLDVIRNDVSLLEEAEKLGSDPEATVAWASGKGYVFSTEELLAHIEAETAQLTEDELEAVAGGIHMSAEFGRGDSFRPVGAAIAIGGGGIAVGGGGTAIAIGGLARLQMYKKR